jgi:hypothetical protein
MDALIGDWLTDPTFWRNRPSVDYRRGVVYVESEEDRGDDGPYPRSAGPEAMRVCGSAAGWLRGDLQARLSRKTISDGGGLKCQENVCCYTGEMEYAPSGLVVFRAPEPDADPYRWKLDAWVSFYSTGMGPEYAEANTRHVPTSLRRLAGGTCAGEPAGSD